MKTEKFTLNHIDSYNIFIPKEIYNLFADKKMNRVRVVISKDNVEIDFYAAVRRDKSSGDFKMMLSKQKQKELNLSLGDNFEMQLFEDKTKYGVEMPEEFKEVLLTDLEAFKIFESFTKGKQRSIIYGVLRFKSSQQKIDKAFIVCENLKRGNHESIKMFKLE